MIPFIHRNPTNAEEVLLKLLISLFGDGSGQETDRFGTRAGWRDLERVIADLTKGDALERKHVFDVLVQDSNDETIIYGISVKSKCLGKNSNIETLDEKGRVYMELTNSPAKLWAPLKQVGISEENYGNEDFADRIGTSILSTVHSWYQNSGIAGINLDNSVHLVFSYGKLHNIKEVRKYQVHVFNLGFPEGIIWTFYSKSCLRGYDPKYPDEALFDWYGLSGGQLKYYPRASEAKYKSSIFETLSPAKISLRKRVEEYWPDEWDSIKENLDKNI